MGSYLICYDHLDFIWDVKNLVRGGEVQQAIKLLEEEFNELEEGPDHDSHVCLYERNKYGNNEEIVQALARHVECEGCERMTPRFACYETFTGGEVWFYCIGCEDAHERESMKDSFEVRGYEQYYDWEAERLYND